MATPRRRRSPATEDGEPLEVIPPHAPSDETAAQLETREVRSQRPPEARVSRKDPRTQTWGIIHRGDPNVVTQAWVYDNIGGGEYKIELYGVRSDGKYGYLEKGLETFTVDDSIPFRGAPQRGVAAQPFGGTPAAAAPNGNTPNIIDMGVLAVFNQMNATAQMQMQMMKDNSAMTIAAIERMNATNTAPRDSGMKDVITALAPILGPIFAAFVAKKDPVEIAAQIAALGGPKQSTTEMMATMREMMEMGELFRGGGAGEATTSDRMWSLAEKVLPGAIEIVKQEAAKRGVDPKTFARGPGAPSAAAVVAATPPDPAPPRPSFASPTLPPETPAPVADEWTPLEPAITQLLTFAGRDPRHIAGMALALADEGQRAELQEKLSRENIEQVLADRFPAIAPVRSWFDDVIWELQVEMGIVDPDADEPVTEETK